MSPAIDVVLVGYRRFSRTRRYSSCYMRRTRLGQMLAVRSKIVAANATVVYIGVSGPEGSSARW